MFDQREDVLQRTPLDALHRALGARMGAFAGWSMPIRYGAGILAEHQHTRTAASLFDICHMGEIRITGHNSVPALERLFPRRVITQAIGTCRYNFLLNEHGGILDDLLVYRLGEEEIFLVVNAGTAAGDLAWLREHLAGKASVEDVSQATGKLDLQGPATFSVLADLGIPEGKLPAYYRFAHLFLGGHPVLISRTGYTGERGVEIYVPVGCLADIWHLLISHEKVAPAGLGARDTLRLEVGYPLYGHELDTETSPVEAGFGQLLNIADRDFIGRSGLLAPRRKTLFGFALEGRRAARAGDTIWCSNSAEAIGRVTSGAYAPSLGTAVAMGYIAGDVDRYAGGVRLGRSFESALPATVADRPFYREGTVRN